MATTARAAADLKAFGIGVKRDEAFKAEGKKRPNDFAHSSRAFWLLHLMIGKQHLFKINERCRFSVVESGPHSPDEPCSEQGCVMRHKKATLEGSRAFFSLSLSLRALSQLNKS